MNLLVTFQDFRPDEIYANANRVRFGKKKTHFYYKPPGKKAIYIGFEWTKHIRTISPSEV